MEPSGCSGSASCTLADQFGPLRLLVTPAPAQTSLTAERHGAHEMVLHDARQIADRARLSETNRAPDRRLFSPRQK
jgi:hypothetical protein